ncbi:MAG: carboxymuconolactone decarboxylase family protein [Rhodospirillales bacterium]|nr:carboxymuconolactone decarboxylase family protein [Rhodospirillales bacterium]MDE2197582.1 carboxymuconolactone decarboxylase family protein [Rhodospirillales bacterium]
MSQLTDEAAEAGLASFMATFGRVPEQFQLLHRHAPGAFAGYGLMRHALMQDRPAAALDLKTKELIFALLDTLAGNAKGAQSHAKAAMALGLSVPELAEGLVQVIMVGGITTWNLVGADVLRSCAETP